MRIRNGILAIYWVALIAALDCVLYPTKLLAAIDSDSSVAHVPSDVEAADELYGRAAALYRQGHWSEAGDALELCIRRFPSDDRAVSTRFFLGEARVQTGQWAEARASYRAFLDQLGDRVHNDVPTAQFRIGEASFLLDEPRRSEEELRHFCKQHGEHRLVKYALPYLAELALRREAYEDAIRLSDRHMSLGPDAPYKPLLTIARSYFAMGQFSAAQDACRRVAMEPQCDFESLAKAQLIDAQSWEREENWPAAARAYYRLAALQPVPPHAATLNRLVSHPSTHSANVFRAHALLQAADCQFRSGNVRLAKQTWVAVLMEFPSSRYSERATQRLSQRGEGCGLPTSRRSV